MPDLCLIICNKNKQIQTMRIHQTHISHFIQQKLIIYVIIHIDNKILSKRDYIILKLRRGFSIKINLNQLFKPMKPKQSLIGNRYLYKIQQPMLVTQSIAQYRTYDKITKRQLILQIHGKNDYLIDFLRQNQIKHAFILFVFDKVQLEDGKVGYVFESGVHSSLQQAIRKIKHFNEEDALVIFKYIVLMVKELHERQIIVERICMQNILVCNYALFKLGHLALQREHPIEYWSPQKLQEKQVTFQSDVFSLGVLLYRLLYGTFPFKADDPSDMIKKIKAKKFQLIQRKSPLDVVISRQVHYLVLSMLDFHQQNRPALNTILSNGCFAFDVQTDLQKYVKSKGAIVPQPFHRKYLVFRPTKIVQKYGDYYGQSGYLVYNIQEKTFMSLYIPQIRMFQTQPRKIQSYYQKIRALIKNYNKKTTQYLLKIDDIQRFRQQPILAAQYCNQGNLFNYLEKRKVFKGWLSQTQTNVLMYLLAIALKQLKNIGITSVHTINSRRIMIKDGNIKLRQPGLITPTVEKKLQSNQEIDYFAPQLKEKMDFVQLDKSDIWSYGIIYIYLLTGQMPSLDQQHHIDLSHLKTSRKNITTISKCLDYNVKKRMQLQDIKMQNVNQNLLNDMLMEHQHFKHQQNELQTKEMIDHNQLFDQSDMDSNAEQIKQNKKVMFKRRKKRLFKHYNKIISQSTTTPCRLIIKSLMGLVVLWLVFFGTFFVNGGIGMLRTNFYRKITVQVPYNYGTTLYNMTILSTKGGLISSDYADYSYEQFKNDLRCAQNHYSQEWVGQLWDFANGSQTVFCLFGFIWAILISILYVIQTHKLDLPTIVLKRKQKGGNKQLYHLLIVNVSLLPSLLFTFFYTFAFEYIIQMTPCLGIQNLAYPKFTSVQAILNGNMGKFFANVFMTVVLWAVLMFLFGYLPFFVKRVYAYIYQWVGIIPTVSVIGLFTLICRVGFGTNLPIEPTWSYKMNKDIISQPFGLFGFFPQVLWIPVFLGGVLIDFVFWVFLKIGLTPAEQQEITKIPVIKARFQRLQSRQKDLGNQKSNIYMIENAYDFQRFD